MLRRRLLIAATTVAVLANDLPLQLLSAADWPWKDRRRGPETAVTQLAEQIDELERHIDTYGTIVAKSPDVWGQARLTKYRRDYETVMSDELKKFETRLNGAISRSDQAFLASALAMQAAVSGDAAVRRVPGPNSTSTTQTETEEVIEVPGGVAASSLVDDENFTRTAVRTTTLSNFKLDAANIGLEPTVELDQLNRYLNHLNELRRINDGDDSADAPGYSLNLVRIPVSVLPGEETREGHGAEVTIIARPNLHDDLLPQTFRQLVINDLVDQLAFPIAKFLDSKDSAKLLESLEEYLFRHTPEYEERLCKLLDRSRQLGSELSQLSGPQLTIPVVAEFWRDFEQILDEAIDLRLIDTTMKMNLLKGRPNQAQVDLWNRVASNEVGELSDSDLGSFAIPKGTNREQLGPALETLRTRQVQQWTDALKSAVGTFETSRDRADRLSSDGGSSGNGNGVPNVPDFSALNKALAEKAIKQQIEKEITLPAVAAIPSRRAQLPFPPSHLLEVYGGLEFLVVAKLASAIQKDETNSKSVLMLDVQKLLAEEFNAAYEFVNRHPGLWEQCQQFVADRVHRDDEGTIGELRNSFLCLIEPPELHNSHTAAMAWMIIVEAALLNERLRQDIHDLTMVKEGLNIPVEQLQTMEFFRPNPAPEARAIFNEYVAKRWPIHVVAVDPITQDQNIADTFSQRREMQLALALAMSSGQIGANSFTRMARRLELDMETIALNRTVVGFSHGDDTFGWRFYPRFQSPDTGGHFQTFGVDMFKGLSRDTYIKASRLEPGIRELTAIIIMPSFVPYVTFDVRANWFELTDPSEKVLTLQDTMDLSADIMRLRQLSATCVRDAHLYRADDLGRMDRTVEALERRLPMQTSVVSMPFENSLGGFEFFNTGIQDLAPELKGFYGEPGIKLKAAAAATPGGDAATTTPTAVSVSTPVNISINGAATTATEKKAADPAPGGASSKTSIFLVGDHFSVHETEVIAGNRLIPKEDVQLLSRQIMRINVPETVQTVSSNDRRFVDIHVATPYGISNHLLVPVADEEKKSDPKPQGEKTAASPLEFTLDGNPAKGCLLYGGNGQCTALACLSDLRIEAKSVCPCPCPADIEFAAFVTVKGPKGAEPLGRLQTKCVIPILVNDCDRRDISSGKLVKLILNSPEYPALQLAINELICALCKMHEPETIEVDGCLRLVGCAPPQGGAVYVKLPKITIKLSDCQTGPICCPPPQPNQPSARLVPPPARIASQPVAQSPEASSAPLRFYAPPAAPPAQSTPVLPATVP